MSDLCKKVLEKLEAYYDNYPFHIISRVEEETHFDDFQHFSDAVKHLNLEQEAHHMVDLDDTSDWAMSGDSNTTGNLCIAFQNADGSITLLREVCEKNKAGVPYLSEAWLPEYNFTKQSPISLSEQERMLQMRYYDGSLSKPLVFRYVYMDDEGDENFKKPQPTPEPECQRCHNLECDLAVALAERDMADEKTMKQSSLIENLIVRQEKNKALGDATDGLLSYERTPPLTTMAEDEAINALIAQGLLAKDASGDLVFQRIKKPYVVGMSHRL